MVDNCLKLSLQPWIHGSFHREIMNSMKSVTILMIDGVSLSGVRLSTLGMGGVHGEDFILPPFFAVDRFGHCL